MAITYNWNIVQLDAYPEKDSLTDVVFQVHWTLSGTDGTYTNGVYGSVGVTLDEGGAYTPFSELTKDQVVGWVKNALGAEQVTQLEANVAQRIADQVNPPIVTPPLPWDNQSASLEG